MATFEEKVSVKLDDKFSGAAKKVEASSFSLKSAFGALAGIAGAAGLTSILKSSVTAFLEQEKSVTRLNGALRASGIVNAAYTKELQGMASRFQELAAVGDEQIINAQRLFIQFGANRGQMEGVTQAALDMSAALGQDLQSTSLLLGRALQGEFSTLGRYGIKITEAEMKAKDFNAVLKKIQERFGGSAQAQAESYQGKIDKLKNTYGDALEKVGQFTVQLAEQSGAFKFLTEKVKQLDTWLGKALDPTEQLKEKIAETTGQIRMLNAQIEQSSKKGLGGILGKWLSGKQVESARKEVERLEAVHRGYEETLKKVETTQAKQLKDLEKIPEKVRPAEKKIVDFAAAFKDLDGSILGVLKTTTNISNELSSKFNVAIAGSIAQATGFLTTMASVGQQIFKVLGSVQSFFDGDVRPVFHKLTDEIDAVNRAMDETERRLDALRGREEQRAAGTEVGLTGKELSQQGVLKDIMKLGGAEGFGMQMTIGKGGIVARIEEDGDIKISTSKGVPLGVKRGDTGEWLPENYAFRGPKGIAVLERLLQAAFSNGLAPSFPTESASTGVTPTANNRSASTFGATTRSSSMMYAGGSKNITIQAIDAISFTDFMRRSGMQSIRDLTRDEGQLLSSTRSVRRSV